MKETQNVTKCYTCFPFGNHVVKVIMNRDFLLSNKWKILEDSEIIKK